MWCTISYATGGHPNFEFVNPVHTEVEVTLVPYNIRSSNIVVSFKDQLF